MRRHSGLRNKCTIDERHLGCTLRAPARQSGRSGQRNLRLRQRVPRILRHQHPRLVLLQGDDARAALRQPHAPHRGVHGGHAQCRRAAESRHRRRDFGGAAPAAHLLSQAGHRQHLGLLGRGVRLLLRAHRRRGAGGHHRGQRLVPQRAPRRHVVRHLARGCGRGDACRQGRHDQAGLHQAEPQRHRHRLDSPGVRGGGRRRHLPHQHDAGHAHRHAPPPGRPCQHDGRLLGTGHLPRGPAHGLPGGPRMPDSGDGVRRRAVGPRRD